MIVTSLYTRLSIVKNAAVTQGYVISVGKNRKGCSHFGECQEAGNSVCGLRVCPATCLLRMVFCDSYNSN